MRALLVLQTFGAAAAAAGEWNGLLPVTPQAVRFANALGSSMVLQQAPASAQLWGSGPPNKVLDLTLQRADESTEAIYASVSVTIGPDGQWLAKLPPVAAEAGASVSTYTVTAKAGTSSAVLTDVVFGDVFVCGGQVCLPICLEFSLWAPLEQSAYSQRIDTTFWVPSDQTAAFGVALQLSTVKHAVQRRQRFQCHGRNCGGRRVGRFNPLDDCRTGCQGGHRAVWTATHDPAGRAATCSAKLVQGVCTLCRRTVGLKLQRRVCVLFRGSELRVHASC